MPVVMVTSPFESTHMKHFFQSTAICISLVLLSGCGGGGSDSGAAAGAGAGIGAEAGAGVGAGTGTGIGSNPIAPDFESLEACISNPWVLVADQAARTLNNPNVTVSGQANIVVFRDGTYTYSPDFTMTMRIGDETGFGRSSGITRGTWTLNGNEFRARMTSSSVSTTVSGSFGTVSVPTPNDFSSLPATVLSCRMATWTYEFDGPSGRVQQTLVAG